MKRSTVAKKLPVDVREALHAICSTGKGRCWYCDLKLPEEARAVGDGWDVQRVNDHPVASIILVCPNCLRSQALRFDPEPAAIAEPAGRRSQSSKPVRRRRAVQVHGMAPHPSGV